METPMCLGLLLPANLLTPTVSSPDSIEIVLNPFDSTTCRLWSAQIATRSSSPGACGVSGLCQTIARQDTAAIRTTPLGGDSPLTPALRWPPDARQQCQLDRRCEQRHEIAVDELARLDRVHAPESAKLSDNAPNVCWGRCGRRRG